LKNGLDLLPILPRALPSGSAVAVVSQRARAPSKTAKTADFVFLSNVYNQFLFSLTCTNNQFFSRTLEYLAVFNIPITEFLHEKAAAQL
jgi:hypothetical protein